MTSTKTFGVGRREGHDASGYYGRKMNSAQLVADAYPLLTSPRLGEGLGEALETNVIHQADARDMHHLPDNSVALAFTSPPYNVGKTYDDDLSLDEYLALIQDVGYEVYRVLRPGGRYVVNIANVGRKPYIPLHAYFYHIHMGLSFLPMGEIIWRKGKGASGSCAWGSWRSAKAPRLRDVHEYLLVFAKGDYGRPDKGESTIAGDEFMAATLSIAG